jgi:hypothetical protein
MPDWCIEAIRDAFEIAAPVAATHCTSPQIDGASMSNQFRRHADIDPATAVTNSVPWPMPVGVDAIRERAFDIYKARGRAAGYDLDDWLQAERELHPNGDVGDA